MMPQPRRSRIRRIDSAQIVRRRISNAAAASLLSASYTGDPDKDYADGMAIAFRNSLASRRLTPDEHMTRVADV
jgi:hypothetical protein